jgi:hypothetical protein
MDERMRFVARLSDGEKMAVLCREFDISRKTGYRLYKRSHNCGIEGLTDRSRRPYRHANRLPFQIENLILATEGEALELGSAEDPRQDQTAAQWDATAGESALCTRFWIAMVWSTVGARSAATEPKARA